MKSRLFFYLLKSAYCVNITKTVIQITLEGFDSMLNRENKKTPAAVSEFNPTKKIGDYLYIDETKEQWAAPKGLFRKKIKSVYNYSDVLDYELFEDGDILVKGGIGRAIVGEALFGTIGAIVGGMTGQKFKEVCTKLQIKITLNNIDNPTEYITLLSTETKKDSFIYKAAYNSAQEILSMFAIMCNMNEHRREE